MVYLPVEKILFESDSFSPAPAGTPAPVFGYDWALSLYENVQRLGLDVDRIAAGHGTRVGAITDLRAALGLAAD